MLSTCEPNPQTQGYDFPIPFASQPPKYTLGQPVLIGNITEESFDTGDPSRYVWYWIPCIIAGYHWNYDFKRWDYALYFPQTHADGYRIPMDYDAPEADIRPRG